MYVSLSSTNTLALFGRNVMLCHKQLKSAKHWDSFLSHCRIIQQSVDTLYPFISSTTVVPLTPVRGSLAIPVIAHKPTGRIEQQIISSERSTLVTGINSQRDFEVMITEIKIEYQTVFGMRIWNKFLETKTIETSMSGIHLGMEPSLD